MSEDLLKSLKESFDNLDPLLRYPAMLMIASFICDELPRAKKTHDIACEDMVSRFMELVREVCNDD